MDDSILAIVTGVSDWNMNVKDTYDTSKNRSGVEGVSVPLAQISFDPKQ